MDNRYYWLALSMIEGLGPIRLSKLIQYFGDPFSIWQASERELARVHGIGGLAKGIVEQRQRINIDKLLTRLKREEIEFITLADESYPAILKNIYDPPPVLFYKGNFIVGENAVAIVGSRRSTGYGRKIAEKLAYELASRGITVISGMARGIDTHGHLGALKAKGRTIAVLGSGLDIIYPPENKELFYEIQKRGMVLSEFPPGVEPVPGNFPQRNRIISGLSLGVVVIEASSRSGSLITAGLALEQGRELFAVPGNINRPQSRGTNDLIKKGAKMVTNIDDILEELFFFQNPAGDRSGRRLTFPELTGEEQELIEILQEEGELHINKIIELSGKKASQVNTILLKLELKGLVSREAGKKYSFLGLQNLLKPL
ncbi:MAG: processing protein [Halanaerobiales bacterium]|nr:processing protein [Halanaerobiales bacterium]